MADNKTKLRSLTLGAKRDFKKEVVKVNGAEIEVRQPTLKTRSAIRKKSMQVSENSVEINMFEFLIWAVIECSFDPESGEKLFTDGDYDDLSNMPAGGWFDELAEVASNLCNVDSSKEKDEAKKSSAETPSVKVSM